MDRNSVIEEVGGIIGSGNVLVSDSELENFSKDMGEFRRRPTLVAKVSSAEQVSMILSYANKNRIPVSPWGAGSSLTGAVVTEGIVIDMSAMRGILKVDTTNWYVHVEAGLVLDDLNRELQRHGFFFPPDPASSFLCTVGGAIAEGSGGLRCVKYGTMRDWVMALKVVLPDGRIMKFGEPLAKNRAGYDLVHLIVGSEGTLCVIVEAWLKIIPIPEARMVRIYSLFDDWISAGEAIFAIRRNKIVPRLLEFLDRDSVVASNRVYNFGLEEAEATLLVDVEEFKGGEAQIIVELLRRSGARIVKVAESEEEADRLLLARSSVYLATAQQAPARMVEDVVVPIDKIVEYLLKVKELQGKHGVKIFMQGHAGDGNIHPIILYDNNDPKSVEGANMALEELIEYAIQAGGSITGEHGVGVQKMQHLKRQLERHGAQGATDLMRQIKRVFDPNSIMNPGKYIDQPE